MENVRAVVGRKDRRDTLAAENPGDRYSASLLTEAWPARVKLPTGRTRTIHGVLSECARPGRPRIHPHPTH